jgi:hypothetical protein
MGNPGIDISYKKQEARLRVQASKKSGFMHKTHGKQPCVPDLRPDTRAQGRSYQGIASAMR